MDLLYQPVLSSLPPAAAPGSLNLPAVQTCFPALDREPTMGCAEEGPPPPASEALPPGPQGLGWGAGSAGDGGAGLGRPLPPKAPENSSKSPRPPCVGSGEVAFLEVQPQSRLMMAQQGCLPLLGEGGRGRSVSLALFGPPPRLAPAPQPDPALVRGQACGSARLRSCQLARPARLPWQPLSMSAGPAAPSSSLAGARATSGRPRGLPGRGGLPRGPLGSWA